MRTGTGATVEFPFPEGTVTLAKLLRPIDGKLKLFVVRGQAIPAATTSAAAWPRCGRSHRAEAFIDTMMREPVEHHVALVYGDWTQRTRPVL